MIIHTSFVFSYIEVQIDMSEVTVNGKHRSKEGSVTNDCLHLDDSVPLASLSRLRTSA